MAWICDVCGEIAEGDVCMHCGNLYAPKAARSTVPGSYWSIIGIHNEGGFAGYALWFAAWAAVAMLALLYRRAFPFAILLAVTAMVALIRFGPMLYTKWRFRRQR